MQQKILFSGIQPSGILHIGNYLGAIKQWVELQDQYRSFFCVVDEHAITVPQDPKELRENTLKTAMVYLAAGVGPKKSTIFVQSHVPAHTELGWILNTITPLGELERMTQFKEKAKIKIDYTEKILTNLKNQLSYYREAGKKADNLYKKMEEWLRAEDKPPFHSKLLTVIHDFENFLSTNEKESEASSKALEEFIDIYEKRRGTNSGLLTYPTLMAADILLYNTDVVPVGEDQLQHIELTRSLAERFNNRYDKTFIVPKALVNKAGARIMGLDSPAAKMSKSAPSANNYIALLDSPDEIRRKIRIAVTDSGAEIVYDEKKKPAISNLLAIYSLFSGDSVKELEEEFAGKGYAEFKKDLAEVIIEGLAPLQRKYQELDKDKSSTLAILRKGAEAAREIAEKTLKEVKEKVGFLSE